MQQSRRERTMKRRKKVLLIALAVVMFVIVALTSAFFNFMASIQVDAHDSELLDDVIDKVSDNDQDPINVLLLGVDQLPGRSDTMIFMSYYPAKNKALVLSIPRDTKVLIPGVSPVTGKPYGHQKIAHAHATVGGISKAVETVKHFLGVDIHYFVRINYQGLHRLVNAIGGVPIDVEYNMDYDDNAGGLHIHLSKGHQVLDGDKAEQYLRWRQNNDGTGDGLGDIGRIKRQQKFMMAFAKQALKPANLMRLGELKRIVEESIVTNVDVGFVLEYGKKVLFDRNFSIEEDVIMETVPGQFGPNGIYWVVEGENKEELQQLLAEFYLPPELEIAEEIIVEILNGCGVEGAATEAASRLAGYPNITVKVGNADSFSHQVTEVISRTDDEIAKFIADRINAYSICKASKKQNDADITVIIGKDFVK